MVATRQDIQGQIAALLGDVKRDIDVSRARRIFCNRNLKMASIELIGFDMDYTLALYQQDRLERLSIELTLRKLVENHGYPEEILGLTYDPRLAIRGVVIDRNAGNVFKMDRHGHVGRVFHGLTLLSKEERNLQYRRIRIRLSSPRYAWIDTLFGLPEAVMYMTLVAHFDKSTSSDRPSYRQLFDDIRASIDEAHRDDTLKNVIKADMTSYVVKDPKLAETLHKLRSSGKKLFLLTNSLFDYSNAVMSYLLDGERKAYPSWRNYFDAIIVGAAKPAFFTEKNPFLVVDPATGQTTDAKVRTLSREKIYQGGNIFDFEDMSNVRGDHVLYVGDHIYGDMIRLKKVHTWRTAMVVQELDGENRTSERLAQQIDDLELLDRRRRNLESGDRLPGDDAQAAAAGARGERAGAARRAGGGQAPGQADPRLAARARAHNRGGGRGAREQHRHRLQPVLGRHLPRGERDQPLRLAGGRVRRPVHKPGVQLPLLLAAALLPRRAPADAPRAVAAPRPSRPAELVAPEAAQVVVELLDVERACAPAVHTHTDENRHQRHGEARDQVARVEQVG